MASFKYGLVSWLPAMITAMAHTDGPILELGCGIGTFSLHWICLDWGRELHSYENLLRWFNFVKRCQTDIHSVTLVQGWDEVPMEQPWGVALIDHCEGIERPESMRRLANWATAIVAHDTRGRNDHKYDYKSIWPLFKFKKHYPHVCPGTVIVSNFTDVSRW